MTTDLYFLRLPVRLDRLHKLAADRHWLARNSLECDEGLALHHALTEVFGPGAVKPFRLMVPPRKPNGFIYGYCRQTPDELRAATNICPPEYDGLFDFGQLQSKPMSTSFPADRKLGFDIRIRPVRRVRKSGDGTPGGETDAFLYEARHDFPDALPGSEQSMEKAERTREAVYSDWLNERLNGAAEIIPDKPAKLVHFRRTIAVRDGTSIEGPDAILQGNLTVKNTAEFAKLVTDGVGRHKAYGYGMLLLRPPGASSC